MRGVDLHVKSGEHGLARGINCWSVHVRFKEMVSPSLVGMYLLGPQKQKHRYYYQWTSRGIGGIGPILSVLIDVCFGLLHTQAVLKLFLLTLDQILRSDSHCVVNQHPDVPLGFLFLGPRSAKHEEEKRELAYKRNGTKKNLHDQKMEE